ncbi:hypothetical protein EDC01DRAFT_626638 [Geopyxis carbonaria]|nr:hypothetical protein EDC01DRAFT_626638 [Geopyxis carbonaria]
MGFWSKVPSATESSSKSDGQPLTKSREEIADAELAALLTQLDSEHQAATELAKKPRDVSAVSAFPETMSCRKAFDDLFYCYSLGGQFLNGKLYLWRNMGLELTTIIVYRYGTHRDCTEKWEDFRFCMKTKVRGEAASRAMIQTRSTEKAAKRKTQPSSEDIWSTRKEPLKESFSGDLEDLKRDSLS